MKHSNDQNIPFHGEMQEYIKQIWAFGWPKHWICRYHFHRCIRRFVVIMCFGVDRDSAKPKTTEPHNANNVTIAAIEDTSRVPHLHNYQVYLCRHHQTAKKEPFISRIWVATLLNKDAVRIATITLVSRLRGQDKTQPLRAFLFKWRKIGNRESRIGLQKVSARTN